MAKNKGRTRRTGSKPEVSVAGPPVAEGTTQVTIPLTLTITVRAGAPLSFDVAMGAGPRAVPEADFAADVGLPFGPHDHGGARFDVWCRDERDFIAVDESAQDAAQIIQQHEQTTGHSCKRVRRQ